MGCTGPTFSLVFEIQRLYSGKQLNYFFCTKDEVLGLPLNSAGLNNPHSSLGITVEQFQGLSAIVFNFTLIKMESGSLRSRAEIMLQCTAASHGAVSSQARKEQKRKCSTYLPRICTSTPLRRDVAFYNFSFPATLLQVHTACGGKKKGVCLFER